MPEAVDVGSVLGGRYKVTAYVLASAERDLVLDGVDQVLNRPVSILVASASNAGQVATSAREVATGERPGNIQVLDLGITDSGTYLVTNRAPAADLLDLVIQQDAPYIEPFFTDTLGSEIFGVARSTEPETYEDDDYYDHEDEHERRPSRLPKARMPRFGRGGATAAGAAGAAGLAGGAAPGGNGSQPGTEPQQISGTRPAGGGGASVPPPPSAPPRSTPAAPPAEQPRAAAWTEDDYDRSQDGGPHRAASRFPAAAAAGGASTAGTQYGDDSYEDYDDDDRRNNPRFTRLLVGVVLALVIVGAVVLAVTQLRPLFGPPTASETTTSQAAGEGTGEASEEPSAEGSSSAAAPEELVDPVPANVIRLVPDNPELNAQTDADLGTIIDGNPASFWGSLVYANETFGGLAQNLALVVELEEPSNISEIQIEQLNSSGGSFTVLLNDEPTLNGATQVAQSGFTGPSVTFNVPQVDGAPPTAQYVIVNFTQLPRLSNVQAQYPWGMRIAEISVS